jgi:hypothetical protein
MFEFFADTAKRLSAGQNLDEHAKCEVIGVTLEHFAANLLQRSVFRPLNVGMRHRP